MGDVAPRKSSTGNDNDNEPDAQEKIKNDDKSNTIVNLEEFLENVKTEIGGVSDIPEISPSAADELSSDDKSKFEVLRRISVGSNRVKKGKKPVFMTFRARQRPRQPFMNQLQSTNSPAPPAPPLYYSNEVTPAQHRPEMLSVNFEGNAPEREVGEEEAPQTTQPRQNRNAEMRNLPQYYRASGGMAPMTNPFFFNYTYWAPYPENIPSNVQPCLAHLYRADSLFLIQQVNFFDIMYSGYFDAPNFYLIQNKAGQVIYYVYETNNLCFNACCSESRGFQLHVMDMYNNEIIYMNRPCGCSNFPCCYPVIEVYSPPLIPVGAVTQVFNATKHEFAVIDTDENLLFKVYGPLCFNICCCCLEVDFTIHALDKEKTQIGVIRREWGGFVRTFLAESDMYGITFPEDLDVRIKAVFLGVLFFIEYQYFEDN